jgi:hypothetical protein
VEDVALQAEGPAIQRMARKMKRLEKKRKRQAEGTWGPLKRERRDKVASKGGKRRIEGLEYREGAKTVDGEGRVDAWKGFWRKGRGDVEVSDMATRARRERTRGTAKDGDAAFKSDEGRERTASAMKGAMTPKTRRERMRVGAKNAEDDSKPSKVSQRNTRGKRSFGSKARPIKSKPQTTPPETSSRATSRPKSKDREIWQVQKASLERKFGEKGWQPSKRLSPDTIEGIRALHASDPKNYKTETLAKHFQITPEAIRRILKSKWRPNEAEAEDRRQRWEKRGVKKWKEMAELGVRPPAKWRALGVTSKQQQEKRGKGSRTRERDDVLWDGRDDVAASESFVGRIL